MIGSRFLFETMIENSRLKENFSFRFLEMTNLFEIPENLSKKMRGIVRNDEKIANNHDLCIIKNVLSNHDEFFDGLPIISEVIIVEIFLKEGNDEIEEKKIDFPKGIKQIDDYEFSNDLSITEVFIPTSVKMIGAYSFSKCLSLKKVTIPFSATFIGKYAFYECISLQEIDIPPSIKLIGEFGFAGCTSLQAISLPCSVRSIGHCAFNGCSSMKEIEIDPYQTNFEDDSFANCKELNH